MTSWARTRLGTDRQTGGRRRGTADHETPVDRSVERVLEKSGLRLLDEVGIWTVVSI